MARDRLLARLPRGPGVEVHAVVVPGAWPPVRYEIWVRDPAGTWWRSAAPAVVSVEEESALALACLRREIAAGRMAADEVAAEIVAERRRLDGAA